MELDALVLKRAAGVFMMLMTKWCQHRANAVTTAHKLTCRPDLPYTHLAHHAPGSVHLVVIVMTTIKLLLTSS